MSPASLKQRIRNGTLAMLLIALALGVVALPEVYRLGGAIRDTLYRNYVSIEAAQHMHKALYALELAERDGTLAPALVRNQAIFDHWIDLELGDITEVGERELAFDIKRRGQRLFGELAADAGAASKPAHAAEFDELHGRVDELIQINQAAMFRADSRAARLSARLTTEFALGLGALLLLGVVLAWTLAWNISKPLRELAERLRDFSLRGPSLRLNPQPLAELQAVATEFNKMAERLEAFEKLNVDRLIYEKSKTEAILESIEDGIVLIDAHGIVTHINEVAAIVLGVEREAALGSPIDDLDSNHPHYLQVQSALRGAAKAPLAAQRIEVELHVRGRAHSYVLKPMPLKQGDGRSLGTILILQDITYLRDQDRARTNLVATLSHELKTPLTSLALSAGLLERGRDRLEPAARAMVETINEDIGRIRHLADDLLDLARGAGAAITLRSARLELAELVRTVARSFALQAEQKRVELKLELTANLPAVRGDPVKLSWAASNLIANALRYTPAGGTIRIAVEPAPGAVRLQVGDSGPGIAAELREHLFERYTQWNVNGFEPGSAGLGLAIVKEIVDAHEGRIFVDSAPGRGTCFTLELPVREEDAWPPS